MNCKLECNLVYGNLKDFLPEDVTLKSFGDYSFRLRIRGFGNLSICVPPDAVDNTVGTEESGYPRCIELGLMGYGCKKLISSAEHGYRYW